MASQVTKASQAQASTMTAAAMMVPAMRPGLPLRMVWLRNICSWARQSSRPAWSPCITGLKRLAFESTQHGADVLLSTSGQLEEDLFQRLAILANHMAKLLEASHRHQPAAVDDGEAGAHPFRDLQDVGREEDRLFLPAEDLEDVFYLAGALLRHAHGGVLEEENLRVVEQRRGERDLLPHTS